MTREEELIHAKGTVAAVTLGGWNIVGKKNFLSALRTLRKYGILPKGIDVTSLDSVRAWQFIQEAK